LDLRFGIAADVAEVDPDESVRFSDRFALMVVER
jgi:hypothetical protein